MYDSFVSTLPEMKENKISDEGGLKPGHKRIANKHESNIKITKADFESSISHKMKKTDGFVAFKPSIGGNSSNSLLPSSSGDTIVNR